MENSLEKEVFDAISKLAEADGISAVEYCEKLNGSKQAKDEEVKNREENKEKEVGSLKSNDTDYGVSYINAMLKAIKN
ncbi:MAG: hypothetical protein IIU65_04595 [Clostridia bacterium]|nr:hypothetical protein [Clostridia bacterium]